MITISNLTKDDFESAYTIETISHIIPWSKNTFLSNQGDHYLNKKITLNNKIVGFLISHVILDEATLFNIAIDPAHRKKGLAKKLLTALIDELTTQNVTNLWLEVRASNIAAINLYEQLGFNQLTIRKNYYPTLDNKSEDAIIMAYTISF
ncbi:ribosomal protein S18-alanine N-acetyltransferase [Orbaceae bacterium ac157xtp]